MPLIVSSTVPVIAPELTSSWMSIDHQVTPASTAHDQEPVRISGPKRRSRRRLGPNPAPLLSKVPVFAPDNS